MSTRFVHYADRVANSLFSAGDERLAAAVAHSFRVATCLELHQKQFVAASAADAAYAPEAAGSCAGVDKALLALLIGTLAVLSPHRFAGGEHSASGLLAALVYAHAHLVRFLRQYLDNELEQLVNGESEGEGNGDANGKSNSRSLFEACIQLLNDPCFNDSTPHVPDALD